MKRANLVLAALALVLGGVGQARAEFIITFFQVGNNVEVDGSGTINLTDLTKSNDINSVGPAIRPDRAAVFFGPSGGAIVDSYGGFTGPSSFGPGDITYGTPGSGDAVGINGTLSTTIGLAVPSGYKSGASLMSNMSFDNTTISKLGLTPGTYTWAWGSAANGTEDDLKVIIPSPEPSTLSLLGIGSISLLGYGWRRRKQAAA
jgi:hypothetical protein